MAPYGTIPYGTILYCTILHFTTDLSPDSINHEARHCAWLILPGGGNDAGPPGGSDPLDRIRITPTTDRYDLDPVECQAVAGENTTSTDHHEPAREH